MEQAIKLDIEKALNENCDNLLLSLFEELKLSENFDMASNNQKSKKNHAKNWILSKLSDIKKYLCYNSEIKEIFQNEREFNKITIAASIFEILIQQFKINTPACIALSCLIVKEGLYDICKDCWHSD